MGFLFRRSGLMVDNTPYWKLHDKHDESLWEDVQKKTFCGWVNMHLAKKDMRVNDLEKDFCDGVKLIALLEILNGKKIEGRYYKNPKSKPYMIDNVHFALNIITDVFGVKLIQCSPEDIVDGNIKIILGMLWRLINRFQLAADNSRTWLLNWCAGITDSYKSVNITNFHSSFQDGLAFCALLHYYDKTLLDFDSLSPEDGLRNIRLAFNIAEEQLDVPQLLDSSDISKGLADERSVMTYLSMIRRAFEQRTSTSTGFSATPRSKGPKEGEEETSSSVPVQIHNDLSDKVSQLTTENYNLKEEIKSLKEEVATLTTANESLKETNRTLQAQIHTNFEDIEDIDDSEELKESKPAQVQAEAPKAEEPATEEPQAKELAEEPKVEEPKAEEPATEEPQAEPKKEETAPVKEEKADAGETEPETKVETAIGAESSKDIIPEDAETNEKVQNDVDKEDVDLDALPDAEKVVKLTKKIKRQTRVIYQLQNSNAELTKEIDDTRAKLLQQVKVSETLQKNLEDTREEVQLIQKKQKKSQDRVLKKLQKRSDRKIQRRDKEIETMRNTHQIEIQKKVSEIETLRRQLKKIQEALGGSMAPKPV